VSVTFKKEKKKTANIKITLKFLIGNINNLGKLTILFQKFLLSGTFFKSTDDSATSIKFIPTSRAKRSSTSFISDPIWALISVIF